MTYKKPQNQFELTYANGKNNSLTLFESVDLKDPSGVLTVALKHFGTTIALASSFSMEDTVLIDMMMKLDSKSRVLALDTGRLNEETLECAEKIRNKYGCDVEWFFPDTQAVEELVRTKGSFSFKESVVNRKQCCFIRKVEPLERALNGLQAWITGQRRQQSSTRLNVEVFEIDSAHGDIVKLNPLAFWSSEQVKEYVTEHNVPYNKLYDYGYSSIGCAPCTRAVREGEPERAGRWWWEDAEHKECGIHLVSPPVR